MKTGRHSLHMCQQDYFPLYYVHCNLYAWFIWLKWAVHSKIGVQYYNEHRLNIIIEDDKILILNYSNDNHRWSLIDKQP